MNIQSTQHDPMAKRPEFLIEMYRQMTASLTRHMVVVWQSIGVVVGSFAILGLVEKQVLSLDIAASLFVLLCSWALALLTDSSYWYNRNLCIIANIERLFLLQSDLRDVHYYFGAHRPNNRMITTLKVQAALCLGIGVIVLAYHFLVEVLPIAGSLSSHVNGAIALPYLVATVAAILLLRLKKKRDRDYAEFLRNSPGVKVSTQGIEYGGGHGYGEGGGN